MKKLSERDALFLAEMGIGPLWQLRDVPAAAVEDPAGAEATTLARSGDAAHAAARPADAHPGEAPSGATGPAHADAPAPRALTPLSVPPYRDPPPADAAPAWDDAAPAEEAAPDIATMDWTALRRAIADCERCGCGKGRAPVHGAGPRQARWLIAAGTPSAADEQAGQPLGGDAGQLLDNMLRAVGLSRERDVYVTPLVKCRPLNASGGERAPTGDEVAACRPFVERELALSGASTVLTLGQIAANGLLGRPLQEPLAAARGAVHDFGGKPLVATLHPGELLRRGADKALAWADLCRARSLDPRA